MGELTRKCQSSHITYAGSRSVCTCCSRSDGLNNTNMHRGWEGSGVGVEGWMGKEDVERDQEVEEEEEQGEWINVKGIKEGGTEKKNTRKESEGEIRNDREKQTVEKGRKT